MSARVAVIDSGICNLRSVTKALEAVGAVPVVVRTPEAVEASGAAGLVLPGVGALRDCVASLRASGLDGTVRAWIGEDRPFLGVCLGMQALFDYSEEVAGEGGANSCAVGADDGGVEKGGNEFVNGAVGAVGSRGTKGLGIFRGRVVKFRLPEPFKVPHMGWNTIRFVQPGTALQAGLMAEGEAFYFVHSFHCVPADPSLVLAECDYGGPFTAAIRRGRMFATQFHPEKSQARGLRIYRNFADLAAAQATKAA
jgi:glutamine amidotransferase